MKKNKYIISICLDWAYFLRICVFSVFLFFFFFFLLYAISAFRIQSALFTRPTTTLLKNILKIGLTILFIYLKIILLQYFHFSAKKKAVLNIKYMF